MITVTKNPPTGFTSCNACGVTSIELSREDLTAVTVGTDLGSNHLTRFCDGCLYTLHQELVMFMNKSGRF